MNEIRDIFFKYAPWFVLIPALLLMWKAAKPGQKILLPLLIYFIASVLTQLVSLLLWLRSINNLPLLHLFTLAEFLLLLWFFYRLPGNILNRRWFIVSAGTFLLFAATDSLYLESIHSFNIFSRSLEALILIMLCVKWFLFVITGEHRNDNGQHMAHLRYVVSGIFIYFTGSVVLFSFSNIVTRLAYHLALNVWLIHTFLLFLFYLFVTVALLKWKTA